MKKNEFNQIKIKGIILGTIIGDALGVPYDGMTKGHISSIFKYIDGYIDPEPALKGTPEKWKKPGFYSCLTQLSLLNYLSIILNKEYNQENYISAIREGLRSSEGSFGIFRNPGSMIRTLLNKLNSQNFTLNEEIYTYPDASLAVLSLPLIFEKNQNEKYITTHIRFSLLHTRDILSIAGALFYRTLIEKLAGNTQAPDNIIKFSIGELSNLKLNLEKNYPEIFNAGINPDYVLSAMESYSNILSDIISAKDNAESRIFSYVNKTQKTQITRATVNNPLAIIPYAIYLTNSFLKNPSGLLSFSVNEGGASSILCSLCGALMGALTGHDWIPENLLNGLVNKKRIFAIIDNIASQKSAHQITQEFIKNEASLTFKEIEEKNARMKHVKPKKKIKKNIKDRERELSKHVVESWTKTDKAKWRKNLEKIKNNGIDK